MNYLLATPFFILLAFHEASAQAVYGPECKKNYPEIGFTVSMRCNEVEEKKTGSTISILNSVKDKSKQREYERTIINLNKFEKPSIIQRNQFEEEAKKALDNVLKRSSNFKDPKWLNGSMYGKKMNYNTRENSIEYRQYVLLKRDGTDFILEYNFQLLLDNGEVPAYSEYFTLQDISSGLASDLRNGKETYWFLFYSSPGNVEYKRDSLARKDVEAFGFSFTHPRHYLYGYWDDANQKVVFTPAGVWDELQAKDKEFGDITIRLIKKLNANETFSTYAATFTKQSANNKLNDPAIKALNKRIGNVLTFTEMLVEDSKNLTHPYHPYKIQFEWNKNIYEISGDVKQHQILKDIYASIAPLVGGGAQNNANASVDIGQQILSVMDAWYTGLLDKNKKDKLPHVPLSGPDKTRYNTDLKLSNVTTYIEQGMLPVDYRYWVAVVGTFESKDDANSEMRKWIPYFDEFKTDLFTLVKTTASPTKMLWKPKILDKTKVQDYFTNMEVIVERAEVYQSGKIVNEVYVKIGSPLNF